jgi:hypothetical protein
MSYFRLNSPLTIPSAFFTTIITLWGIGVMSRKLAMTPTIKTSNLSKPEKVACPKCGASLVFYRSDKPHIDECGFESYSLKCRACGAMLTGIIDPADDALLVTISS